jgi:hypothetical protein
MVYILATSEMSDFTSILFAKPSFWEGWARIVDFGNTLTEYNRSRTGEQADRFALTADWAAIGEDIRCVLFAELSKIDKSKDERLKAELANRIRHTIQRHLAENVNRVVVEEGKKKKAPIKRRVADWASSK